MSSKTSSALLSILLFQAGCSRPQSADVRYSDGVLSFVGRIDDAAVQTVERMPHERIRRLVITSPGGKTSAAIRLVRLLGVGKYDVVVRDYCASACASILFAAAKNRFIEGNSALIFHGSDFAKMQLAVNAYNPRNLVWSPIDQLNSREEAKIYRQRRIDPVFFQLAELRRNPICFADADASGPQNFASFVMGTTGYWPPVAVLNRFGMMAQGRELTVEQRNQKVDQLRLRLRRNFSVASETTAAPSIGSIVATFRALRLNECDAEMTNKVVSASAG